MNKACGIYQIKSLQSGNIYIGQSMNMPKRWNQHLLALRRGKHYSRHLQSAYLKYGVNNFEFKPLIYCEQFELTRYEQYFVDTLKPEYNTHTECVDSPLGTKRPESASKISAKLKGITRSPETRAKMSKSQKGKTRSAELKKRFSEMRKGRPHTEEEKKKISAALKGRIVSPEHARKLALANVGKHSKPLSKEHKQKVSSSLKSFYSKKKMLILSADEITNILSFIKGDSYNSDLLKISTTTLEQKLKELTNE